MSRIVSVEVWADVVCPWCWVGKRRLEAALQDVPHDVEVRWRSFELDPSAAKIADPTLDNAARLAKKYGRTLEEAQAMLDRMTKLGAEEGLEFRFDRSRPANSFDAHRLAHFALQEGKQAELEERLFRAHFNEGRAIGDRADLVDLAVEVGLDRERTAAVLAGTDFADDVRRDEALARELGIRGVPFFVIAGRYGVSGAQPVEILRQAVLEGESE